MHVNTKFTTCLLHGHVDWARLNYDNVLGVVSLKTTPPAEWRTGLLNYKLPITRLYSCSDLLLIFIKLVRCTRRWLSVI